jgi:tetratricopeptide (TPR) repeat protein
MGLLTRFRVKFCLYREWFRRWRTLPVSDWVRAAALYKEGRYREALELYEHGLRSHPEHAARAHVLMDAFYCCFRLHLFDRAEQYLRHVIIENPLDREPYLRLARLHMWLGYSTEAAWCMRECLRRMTPDPELVTQFISAVVECGGVSYLDQEVEHVLQTFHCEPEASPRLEVAKIRFELMRTNSPGARQALAYYACLDKGPFDAVIAFAELLLREGKVAYARHHLHRALLVAPEHPRILRLLAHSYMITGSFFEPEFAVQLATRACQITAWSGVQEMHTLAQAHALHGDKMSALLIASRAKDAGLRLLGTYPHAQNLDRLIEQLSTETRG